jgi:hypothetical protein
MFLAKERIIDVLSCRGERMIGLSAGRWLSLYAVAFPLTLLLIMTLGLLQVAISLPLDDWSHWHVWPLIYVFYLAGLARARRRYL